MSLLVFLARQLAVAVLIVLMIVFVTAPTKEEKLLALGFIGTILSVAGGWK